MKLCFLSTNIVDDKVFYDRTSKLFNHVQHVVNQCNFGKHRCIIS